MTYPDPDGAPEALVPRLVSTPSVSVLVLVFGMVDGSGDVMKLVWVTV
jgi:hypothetical protein